MKNELTKSIVICTMRKLAQFGDLNSEWFYETANEIENTDIINSQLLHGGSRDWNLGAGRTTAVPHPKDVIARTHLKEEDKIYGDLHISHALHHFYHLNIL